VPGRLYLDIEEVHGLKPRSLDCHKSQKPDGIWDVHEAMHRRGQECGAKRAEAYVRAGFKKDQPALLTFLSRKK
jgi:hypothetical protein